MRVGIPRAMSYYYLYPFFRTLLTELGAEPVLSPPTTKKTLERMEVCPTDEPCLAVKLHFSHASELADRKDIDFLFLPIVARIEKTCCCPKFIGIADMTHHGLGLRDDHVMMPVLDYSDNDAEMCASLQQLADRLGVKDRAQLRTAVRRAREAQQQFRDLCITQQVTVPEAYRLVEQGIKLRHHGRQDGPRIAVIGHPYIIYEIISQGMIERLREYGQVTTAEMVAQENISREMATIDEGARLWPFEAMLLGAALHLLRTQAVDKLILVGSFECGPESIIESFIEEEAHKQGIPLMVLALDEHSGEAGLTTRIEAFLDTEKIGKSSHAEQHAPPALRNEEIILGFPSMGYLDIAIRYFVESFGTKTVATPRTLKTCVELGQEISPEFVCFPFTATLGQMRYMLDHGANTLMMVGGKGFCRLGWYAQVQQKLLHNIGYDFELIRIENPFPLKQNWGKFSDSLKRATGGASWGRIISRMYDTHQLMTIIDRAETLTRKMRAFEREQGTANRMLDRFISQVSHIGEISAARKLEREFRREMAGVEVEETNPLKVRIAGEIWVVLEHAATRDVERWLGSRSRPRVWVEREHSTSSWFNTNVLRLTSAMRREKEIIAAAKPWLSCKVGGHGQLTVGQTALARREGMDGVLHIFPFTCMPEIIAQNIIVRLSEQLDIPVLTFIVSEQTGEAGMETRLESFLDLLEERRFAGQLVPAHI